MQRAVAPVGEVAVITVAPLLLEAPSTPADEILNTAEERGTELVCVGRTGRGAVERFLMRSVSDRVVRHAASSPRGAVSMARRRSPASQFRLHGGD
jgi:nucleotide-binding universal stress UspA family protein